MRNKKFAGDVIHLLGYYPSNPITSTEHPRPFYTNPKPATSTITDPNTNIFSQHDQHNQRPTSWEHETNHISFHPLVHPGEHFGIADEDGFGSEADVAVFNHNNYGNKPTAYGDSDNYRPFQGTNFFLYSHVVHLVLFFSFNILDL